jgi:hypothetical protein
LNLGGAGATLLLPPPFLLVFKLDRSKMCGQGWLPVTVPFLFLCLLS